MQYLSADVRAYTHTIYNHAEKIECGLYYQECIMDLLKIMFLCLQDGCMYKYEQCHEGCIGLCGFRFRSPCTWSPTYGKRSTVLVGRVPNKNPESVLKSTRYLLVSTRYRSPSADLSWRDDGLKLQNCNVEVEKTVHADA